VTPDRGFVIAAGHGGLPGKILLSKLDVRGDSVWARTYGGINTGRGESVILCPDGGFAVASDGGYDIHLIKTDPYGNEEWIRKFCGPGLEEVSALASTPDNGYLIVGYSHDGGSGYDVYLLKVASSGDSVWARTVGATGYDVGRAVVPTADGGFVIAGTVQSTGPYDRDVFLIKIDSAGSKIWARTFGGADDDEALDLAGTLDRGFIISGITDSPAGDYDVYLLKTDAFGNVAWSKTYGGDRNDFGVSVTQTADGGYIVAGSTDYCAPGRRERSVLLIKTDSRGEL
jgi:hypothetical protein